MAVATRASEICRHCGSHNIFPDDEGKPYCCSCGRTYHDFRDFGRIGGLQTVLRHGRERMAEIGRRGGLARRLPTIEELRQQMAPTDKIELKGGMVAQPNNLKVLKELWRQRREELLAASSSSQEVI